MAKYLIVCDPPVSAPGHNTGGTHQVIAYQSRALKKRGDEVDVLSADLFGQIPKKQTPYSFISKILDDILTGVDFIHIATVGRLSFLVRRYCVARGLRFTTAYHTRYPELMEKECKVPQWVGYKYIRYFHKRSSRVIVPTPSLQATLHNRGLTNTVSCLHGVDVELFKPGDKKGLDHLGLPRPYWLYVGRVSHAKNVPAFLALKLEGTKIIVGDGPLRKDLQNAYPNDHFAGIQRGECLAAYYDAADVFVLPSLIESFSLVLLEALAAGVPVASAPTEGPVNVIGDSNVGCLDWDLRRAALKARELSSQDCRKYAENHSWDKSVERFVGLQVPAGSKRNGSIRLGLERRCNVPAAMLERLVDRAENRLFGAETK